MGQHGEVKQALKRQGWLCDPETKLWCHPEEGQRDLSFKEAAIYAIEKGGRRATA